MPESTTDQPRDPTCVEAWPECFDGGYDPRCCRFPKSCSCVRVDAGTPKQPLVICGAPLGSRPSWMSEWQYDPCRCKLPAGHEPPCTCEHLNPERIRKAVDHV